MTYILLDLWIYFYFRRKSTKLSIRG